MENKYMPVSELEFEQKYLLDPRQAVAIVEKIGTRSDVKRLSIRQFYNKDGLRYRHLSSVSGEECKVEKKRSLKLGTAYSVNVEDQPTIIAIDEFERKWERSKRRLSKARFEFSGTPIGHTIMVDCFLKPGGTYAVVAEVETIINAETKTLFLDLALPIYLEKFLLKKIDARGPEAKIFKSANMIDTNIEMIEQAITDLYDPV